MPTAGKGRTKESRPTTTTQEGRVRVFSYGANMNGAVLRRRNVRAITSVPAVLRGYAFSYRHRGGYGTITPLPTGEVLGVVQEFSLADFETLKEKEKGYRVATLRVCGIGNDAWPHDVLAFTTPPSALLQSEPSPLCRYMDVVITGARESGLPETYVSDNLEREACVPAREAAHYDVPSVRYGVAALLVAAMVGFVRLCL